VIIAELRGKLSRNVERMEDVLTSNVFSFLKYSDRSKCLRAYLNREFGIEVSDNDAKEAEFRFWYAYDDGTEPDVIFIVGDFYVLFEAKYYSGFGAGDDAKDPQTEREVRYGLQEAGLTGKAFLFAPITADFYFKEDKGFVLKDDLMQYVRWTSWQRFAAFLEDLLDSGVLTEQYEKEFASDLRELLDRKNLRGFRGFDRLIRVGNLPPGSEYCFYDARTSTSRGAFIGFAKTLGATESVNIPDRVLFLSTERELFRSLRAIPEIMVITEGRLFWEV